MIKRIFIIVVVLCLALLPICTLTAFADVNDGGWFYSSQYSTSIIETYLVNSQNANDWSYSLDPFWFDFDYDFGSNRLYFTYYYDISSPNSNLIYYQPSSNSYNNTLLQGNGTLSSEGFLLFDSPPYVGHAFENPNPPPYVTWIPYNGGYTYFYSNISNVSTSILYVNSYVTDITGVPVVLTSRNPRINYDTDNYAIFGSVYSSHFSYVIYDFVTDYAEHLYFVFLTGSSYYQSNVTYYFATPSSDFDTGYTFGYGSGYNDGYSVGSSAGYGNGFEVGYDSGYSVGYSSGYTEAIDDGAVDNSFVGLISAVIDVPLNVIKGLFDFNILGVNLLQFFYSIFTLLLLLFIIKILVR